MEHLLSANSGRGPIVENLPLTSSGRAHLEGFVAHKLCKGGLARYLLPVI